MNTAKTIQQNTEKSQDCLINDKLDFYKWFNNIAPKLAHREISFKKIFKYLDGLPTPIIILETGCLRKAENFIGDGQSTLLFDKYT